MPDWSQRIWQNALLNVIGGLDEPSRGQAETYPDEPIKEEVVRIGGCLLLDPGEIMGMYGRPTYALLDTDTMDMQWVEV